MAEGLNYVVTLEDQMSKPAHEAGGAVHGLGEKAHEAHDKLKELSMGFLKTVEPAEVMRHAFEAVGAGFQSFTAGVKSGEAKEMIEGISESLAGLASTLDLILPGLGQVASAAIKVGGAFAAMSVGLVQSGIEQALEVTAVNDKLIATFNALGDAGEESGVKTLAMLDEMSKRLPQGREQLAQWTKQFESMGDKDLDHLKVSLQAVAGAQAIMGNEGAQSYLNLTKKVNEAVEAHHGLKLSEKSLTALYNAGINVTDMATHMGLSVEELTKRLKKGTIDAQTFGDAMEDTLLRKGKEPLKAMMDETDKLKIQGLQVFGHLFDDVDTKPLVDAIKSVIDLGDQGEPSGQALKTGITGALNAIIKEIAHLTTEAEIFFLKMEIAALQLELRLKPLLSGLKDIGVALGLINDEAPKQWGGNGIAPGAPGSPSGQNRVSTGPMMGEAALLGGVFGGPLAAMKALNFAAEYLRTGQDFAASFTTGIGAGTGSAKAFGKDLGQAALDGTKDVLKAHSPSRVMVELGLGMGQGMAMGMHESSRLTQREGMMMAGYGISGVNTAAFGGGRSAGGRHITIGSVTIEAPHGVTNAQDVTVTGLSLALERYMLGEGR